MKRAWFFRLWALTVLLALVLCGCSEQEVVPKDTTSATETTPVQTIPTSLNVGSKIPELTFTDAQGKEISVQELLQEKKLVVLNFWFADCGWCRKEFPVMELAYQRFREDVEILAVNPFDSQDVITAFQEENSLSFPMLRCPEELAYAFRVNGYPTSVCIDREGTVSLIHSGAITDVSVFIKLFETYTDENYQSRVFNSVNEILN